MCGIPLNSADLRLFFVKCYNLRIFGFRLLGGQNEPFENMTLGFRKLWRCENTAWAQVKVNCRCSLKSVTLKKPHLWHIEVDRWAARNLFYKEEAKDVSVLWAMLLCKALINTAASLITGNKRNIDCERRESWRKQDKDGCCYLRPLYANMERSAKASQCHSGLCWFSEPEQSAKRSRRPCSLNVIHNPFWPQEMKCVCLSVCYVMCLARFESSSQRWARHRFNYAAIECDSLITKGRMRSLISTPRAAGSAQDDRTNRFLE